MPELAGRGLMSRRDFPADAANKSAIKILIVDDNDASRYSVVRSLREVGYQIVEARTGSQALALAAEAPDLITLDVNLPDLHGFEVCRKLKSDPATAGIPILHLSCTAVDPESRVLGLASGADAYLTEPVDRAELVATIGALLRLKAAETAARQQADIAESARLELARLNETLETRVNDRTTELKSANESLRQLSSHLLRMQDEERRRIARELHDGIGQLLAAIKMNNDLICRENLSDNGRLAALQSSNMVDEILSGIRTISHLLHPPLLDEAGLPSALRWYVEEFSQRSGIQVGLYCDEEIGRLPADLETTVFRIVQEALGNVHRHAQSPTAQVRLELRDAGIHLEISDDGRGISPELQSELSSGGRSGVGLRGMRERIAQFGGNFKIQSSGRGTRVTADLPTDETRRAKTTAAD
jgi:signal transduction histidine kinase